MPKDIHPSAQPHPPPPPPVMNDSGLVRGGQHHNEGIIRAPGPTYYPPPVGRRVAPFQPYTGPPAAASSVGADDELTLSTARRIGLNQRVTVKVTGAGWLIGTVICILKTVERLTGSTVRVRYYRDGRALEGEFRDDPAYIRPYEGH